MFISLPLECSGRKGRQIFDNEAIALIAKHTQGVPRKINIVAHKAMLFASSKQSHNVDKDHACKPCVTTRLFLVYIWLVIGSRCYCGC